MHVRALLTLTGTRLLLEKSKRRNEVIKTEERNHEENPVTSSAIFAGSIGLAPVGSMGLHRVAEAGIPSD
jgi:inactivated superfamily I helicase